MKPIFIVELPFDSSDAEIGGVSDTLRDIEKDYYILIHRGNGSGVKFECFYEKDFNEVKYDELKNIVKEKLCVETKQEH